MNGSGSTPMYENRIFLNFLWYITKIQVWWRREKFLFSPELPLLRVNVMYSLFWGYRIMGGRIKHQDWRQRKSPRMRYSENGFLSISD
jgi:hypothetical protein